MQLMTKELEERFKKIGSQQNRKDPIVIAKYFNPAGTGTWYATEYNPKTKIFFGFVSIFGDDCDEWGYFSLQELEELLIAQPYNIRIERDLHCGEKPISQFNIKTL